MLKLSELKWKRKLIYNFEDLKATFKNLDIYNKKIIDLRCYEKPDYYLDEYYFVDVYNNMVSDGSVYKKKVTIKDIPDDLERSRSLGGELFVLKFEDNSTLELYSNKPSKLYIGYNGLKNHNLKEYEDANLILKKVLNSRIIGIDLKRMPKEHSRRDMISEKSTDPFLPFYLILDNKRKIYFSFTNIILFNSKTDKAEMMSMRMYKKAVYNIRSYFSKKSIDRI